MPCVHMTFNAWPEIISFIAYACQVCVKKEIKNDCSISANAVCSSLAETNFTFTCKALCKRVVVLLKLAQSNYCALQLNKQLHVNDKKSVAKCCLHYCRNWRGGGGTQGRTYMCWEIYPHVFCSISYLPYTSGYLWSWPLLFDGHSRPDLVFAGSYCLRNWGHLLVPGKMDMVKVLVKNVIWGSY